MQTRSELEATIEARRELGPGHDDELVAGFLDRIDREIDRRVDERVARKVPRKKGHSIALPSLGIAIPLIAIAGGTAGLAGVIAVCIAIVLVNVIHARA